MLIENLKSFYYRYIRTIDPLCWQLRHSIITFLVVIALVLLYSFFDSGLTVWGGLTAFLMMQVRIGSTRSSNGLGILLLGVFLAVLVCFATVVGNYDWGAIGFIFVVTFVVIYSGAYGVGIAMAGLLLLFIIIFALGVPGSWKEAVSRSVTVLLATGVVFTVRSLFCWINFRKVLKKVFEKSLNDMNCFFEGIINGDDKANKELRDRAARIARDFDRLVKGARMSLVDDYESFLKLDLNLKYLFESLCLLWQRQVYFQGEELAEHIANILIECKAKAAKYLMSLEIEEDMDFSLSEYEKQIVAFHKQNEGKFSLLAWREVFGLFYSIESVAENIKAVKEQMKILGWR